MYVNWFEPLKTGPVNTHTASSHILSETANLHINQLEHSVRACWWWESSITVFRPLSGGIGCWWDKRFPSSTRSWAVWWEHPKGKETEINLLQLLCILPLLWGFNCCNICGLDRRQQRLAMGFWDLHSDNIDLHPNLSPWLYHLQDQNSHGKPYDNHIKGRITQYQVLLLLFDCVLMCS